MGSYCMITIYMYNLSKSACFGSYGIIRREVWLLSYVLVLVLVKGRHTICEFGTQLRAHTFFNSI